MIAAKKPFSALITVLGSAGILFALVAAQCDSNLEFPPYVQEICTDNIDNDEDGKTDCDDSDCSVVCGVKVEVFTPPDVGADSSVKLTGTHENASTISVSVTPNGTGGAATITGASWEFTVRNISTPGIHTATILATSAKGRTDTATTTFQKRN